jgi:type I restriction enzyme S subunit
MEYINDNEEEYEDNFVIKKLEEVCSIDYGTRIVKGNNTEGDYPVYGSGRAMFTTNSYNREGFNVLIGRFALSLECVRFIKDKIFLNDSGLSVKPKTNTVLHKYIAYYLFHNQNIIYNCARGTAQKNLDMEEFKSIKIPIPSIEKQKEIINYLDSKNNLINELETKIKNIKLDNHSYINNIFKKKDKNTVSDVDSENSDEEIIVLKPKPKSKLKFVDDIDEIDEVSDIEFDQKKKKK